MSMDDDLSTERVKFYGLHDFATSMYADRVAEIALDFDHAVPPTNMQDVLELFNVLQYLENNLLPASLGDAAKHEAVSKIPHFHAAIGKYFSNLTSSNFAQLVQGVRWQYIDDLLELLSRNRVFTRCDSKVTLAALTSIGVHVGQMLTCRSLVDSYDADVAEMLRDDASNAEIIIRAHLEKHARRTVHLPKSLSPEQLHQLIESYLDSDQANLNFVRLVRDARPNSAIGIDAKLKLQAKHRHAEMTTKLFDSGNAIATSTGYGIGISQDQSEPVKIEMNETEGTSILYTYGATWLDQMLDEPNVMNTFVYLFDFCDDQALLTMPSYKSQIGTIEGLFGTRGKDAYVTGGVFNMHDALTELRLGLYTKYLESKKLHLEDVVQWFFESYLPNEFSAENFSFSPSDPGTSYLMRTRHIFSEMEGVANQFSMYAEERFLDRELLSISGDQVRYATIGSLIPKKYAYVVSESQLESILFWLFSDQSRINYINQDLQARTALELLTENSVAYEDYREHQTPVIDNLIDNGIIQNTGERLHVSNRALLNILRSFHGKEAVSVHHLSHAGRAEIASMLRKGWVSVDSTLLTKSEASYFDYYLNSYEFSNGPQLRNKYQHGNQAYGATEDEHARSYICALRLLICLVLKINDDLCLSATSIQTEALTTRVTP